MTSPILGPYDGFKAKRAMSLLDHDYHLMGLSGKNAIDENESFIIEHGTSLEPHNEDLNFDLVNKDQGLKMPF